MVDSTQFEECLAAGFLERQAFGGILFIPIAAGKRSEPLRIDMSNIGLNSLPQSQL
jgi:hypothetical protein